MKNPHIGSNLDELLREDGIYEEVNAIALKRVLVRQFIRSMELQHISKAELARRMHTSRAQLDRLLDPDNAGVTLDTVARAAMALGHNMHVGLTI